MVVPARHLSASAQLLGHAQETAGERSGTFYARGDSLLLDRAFVFSDSNGSDPPAPVAIDVDVRGTVRLSGPAELTAELIGSADVGDIRILRC